MSSETRYDGGPSLRAAVAESGGVLAGLLLLLTSCMNILQGISAVAKDEVYAAGNDYVYALDLTAWGTVHLILGVLGVIVSIGILMHASWAQVVGMIIAGFIILTNFAFLPYYPLWSIVIISFSVFVIWALSVKLRD